MKFDRNSGHFLLPTMTSLARSVKAKSKSIERLKQAKSIKLIISSSGEQFISGTDRQLFELAVWRRIIVMFFFYFFLPLDKVYWSSTLVRSNEKEFYVVKSRNEMEIPTWESLILADLKSFSFVACEEKEAPEYFKHISTYLTILDNKRCSVKRGKIENFQVPLSLWLLILFHIN